MYFIVSKFFVSGDWAYKLYGTDVTVVTLRLERINVTVINIYNPINNQEVIIISKLIEVAIDKVKNKVILLKDFNAHHPIWGERVSVYKSLLEYFFSGNRADGAAFINITEGSHIKKRKTGSNLKKCN